MKTTVGTLLTLCAFCLLVAGCRDSTPPASDAGTSDAGPPPADASPAPDAAPPDAAGDEPLPIPGLSGPVEVNIDDAGILHLSCQTDEDCYAAQGYFHAAHRFFQMDLRRRLVRGRISEIAGKVALEIDATNRLIFSTRDGAPVTQALLDGADDATRAMLTAYTRGVNAWLAHLRAGEHGARTASERNAPFLDKTVLDDWEVQDSVASVLLLIDSLTNRGRMEATIGQAFNALGPEAAADLTSFRPASPSTILPSQAPAGPFAPLTLQEAHKQELLAAEPLLKAYLGLDTGGGASGVGSNNWVVGPSLAGGKTLLANDPHLGLSNPAIWYIVHLDAKTAGSGELHVAGASFAGLPGVVLGQNEDIAWGATNSSADFTDVYIEQLSADGKGVMLDGKAVPFVEREETFKLANGGDPVTRTLRFVPHHGPVIAGPDPASQRALTLRWTLQDADTDVRFMLALWRSKDVTEARAALRNVTTIGQNWVVIDRQGSFGWFPYNRWPRRPFAKDYPPVVPLPGTGEAEWGAPIPYEEVPQLLAPAEGFIATANNDYTGAMADGNPLNDAFEIFQWFPAAGFRHERIVDLLQAKPAHDVASMQAIQADVHSLLGERGTPHLLAVVAGLTGLSAGAQQVVDALQAWDFECPTGLDGTDPASAKPVADAAVRAAAAGCAAFHVTWDLLFKSTFRDEAEAAGLPPLPSGPLLLHALSDANAFNGRSYWDDVSTPAVTETKEQLVTAALEAAAAFLVDKLGADPDEWMWGRIHTLTLRADLFSSMGVTAFDAPTRANDGGWYTVDVAAPLGGGSFAHSAGASMRLVCEASAADPVRCTIELPGGQVHHRDDPHYLSLFEDWLNNKPRPIPFSLDAARTAAVRTIQLVPQE